MKPFKVYSLLVLWPLYEGKKSFKIEEVKKSEAIWIEGGKSYPKTSFFGPQSVQNRIRWNG